MYFAKDVIEAEGKGKPGGKKQPRWTLAWNETQGDGFPERETSACSNWNRKVNATCYETTNVLEAGSGRAQQRRHWLFN